MEINILKDKIKGCFFAGAIGDALGFPYEGNSSITDHITDIDRISLSDDTQLTLATIEGIVEKNGVINPESIGRKFAEYFKSKKIRGMGSSTLKALRELAIGGHWALVGATSEFSAETVLL